MNTVVGAPVAIGTTNDTQIVITDVQRNEPVDHMIEVIAVTSGGIKFGKGTAANGYPYVAGGKLIIKCLNGELYAKLDNAANTFVVNV
jgi:ribosomal protein S11